MSRPGIELSFDDVFGEAADGASPTSSESTAAESPYVEEDFFLETATLSIGEVKGLRATQQDSVFIAQVQKAEVKADPATYLRNTLEKSARFHAKCLAGTTVCSVIVTPPSAEEIAAGKKFPKLTIANLGDSRAFVLIKLADGSYRSVVLTEDMNSYTPRMKRHLYKEDMSFTGDAQERVILESELGEAHDRNLNLGASLGDCGFNLTTTPDIYEYDLNTAFAGMFGEIDDITLGVSCDGLFDVFEGIAGAPSTGADYEVVSRKGADGNYQRSFVAGSSGSSGARRIHLTTLAERFEDFSADGSETNLARLLVQSALAHDSGDNISVATAALVKDGENICPSHLMLTVCDGHSLGANSAISDEDHRHEWSADMVSASVAAHLLAGAGSIVPDLEVEDKTAMFLQRRAQETYVEHLPAEEPRSNFQKLLDAIEKSDDVATITAMLEAHPELRVEQTGLGRNALHVAAIFGRAAICAYLCEHGFDVNYPEGTDRTALHHAAEFGEIAVLEVLAAHGANLRLKTHADYGSQTASQIAIFYGQELFRQRLYELSHPAAAVGAAVVAAVATTGLDHGHA